jgi:hypothetical protein
MKREPYRPPDDAEPLDAVEQAVVDFWIDVIAAQIQDELENANARTDVTPAGAQDERKRNRAPQHTTENTDA